jgi:hypothetical protein
MASRGLTMSEEEEEEEEEEKEEEEEAVSVATASMDSICVALSGATTVSMAATTSGEAGAKLGAARWRPSPCRRGS